MVASRLFAYRVTWAPADAPEPPTQRDTEAETPCETVVGEAEDSVWSECSAVELDTMSPGGGAMSPMAQQKQRQPVECEPWPALWGRLVSMGWRQETRESEGGRKDHYYIPPHRREGTPRRLDSRVKVRRYVADGAVFASGTPRPTTTASRPAAAPQVLALPLPRQLPQGPKKSRQRQLSQQPPTLWTASSVASTAAYNREPAAANGDTSLGASGGSADFDGSFATGAVCVKRRRLAAEEVEEQEAQATVPAARTELGPNAAGKEASVRVPRPTLSIEAQLTAAGATDRMIERPQSTPKQSATAPAVRATAASEPSRRIRKPPPRWCEDPLATAELGGSAAKLLELELQRRQFRE